MEDKKFPSHEEIQKEFEEFVKKRFGGQVQVVTQAGTPPQSSAPENNPQTPAPTTEPVNFLEFDLKPKQIKERLDRYIIQQDEAKKVLAIAVCDHYNQARRDRNTPAGDIEYSKQNVLVLGPTGVGKTYMVKQIAKLIGVPFVKADATRFSETGYMGANVEDLIKDLVSQADRDIERAQYGIIYLDEADKLASPSKGHGKDVSGRGVQLGLLKLMEESEFDLRASHDPASQIQAFIEFQQKGKLEKQIINTKHILFIVSGAFTGLEDIIKRRLGTKEIGFAAPSNKSVKHDDRQLLHDATTQDFIEYGFEPEFIGRLPVRVACDSLDATSLFEVLRDSAGSIIRQYERTFEDFGISLTFTDEALKDIAKQAAQEKTGARGLMTICERILRDFKYELPSTQITSLEITRKTVRNPKRELKKLLANRPTRQQNSAHTQQIETFRQNFLDKTGMTLSFTPKACEVVSQMSGEQGVDVELLLNELFQSYEYGLKLIQQNTGVSTFHLDSIAITDPNETLEKMIRDSYREQR